MQQEGDDYTSIKDDGKFYDPKDLEGAKYDAESKNILLKMDKKLHRIDKAIIRAEPTAAPIGMNNVASGLGLPAPETGSN